MPLDLPDHLIERIRTHAFRHITERQQFNTNLSLVNRLYKAGDHIGPRHQRIYVDQPTAVVFADDEPLANFGHPCRYLLYSPENGEFRGEVPARFPPNVRSTGDAEGRNKENGLTPFFSQVAFVNPIPYRYWPPIYRCPRLIPEGNRYAILFAGLTQGRHLNDMEFAYRTLIDVYGFKAANIFVLNYDGTRKVWDKTLGNWPGNNTPYTINVTGQGTRAGFQAVYADLAAKMGPEDLLFIHTNNHGDFDSNANQSFLCGWVNDVTSPPPNSDGDFTYYYANEFAADLAVLPAYRALIVMMEQCNSGGFNAPILASSTAASSSVSSAATASVSSWGSADGNWDIFAYEWMAAMNGAYPNGSSLTSSPDTNHDGVIDTLEAYNYAVANDSSDTPQFSASAGGAALTLDQYYVYFWLWCWIVWPIFEPIYRELYPLPTYPPQPNPPDPGPYYELVNRVLPELQKLVLPAIDNQLGALRSELEPRIATLLNRSAD
jgi:hypothetical protein